MDALANPTLVVSHRGSVVQARMSRARVLVDRLDDPQSVRASSTNVDVVDEQCPVLQKPRFNSHLEQLVRMGRYSGLCRTQNKSHSRIQRCT